MFPTQDLGQSPYQTFQTPRSEQCEKHGNKVRVNVLNNTITKLNLYQFGTVSGNKRLGLLYCLTLIILNIKELVFLFFLAENHLMAPGKK